MGERGLPAPLLSARRILESLRYHHERVALTLRVLL